MVRAKFQCHSVKKYSGTVWHGNVHERGFLYAYEFGAVTGDKGENKSFFASTPSGSLRLDSVREDLFEPGKFYYLDFSEAEE